MILAFDTHHRHGPSILWQCLLIAPLGDNLSRGRQQRSSAAPAATTLCQILRVAARYREARSPHSAASAVRGCRRYANHVSERACPAAESVPAAPTRPRRSALHGGQLEFVK